MAKGRRNASGGERTTVTATEAAKNFGELVNRVREAGVAYVVERQGRPIAEIGPISRRRCTLSELVGWLERRQSPPDEYVAAVKRHLRSANKPRVPTSAWAR